MPYMIHVDLQLIFISTPLFINPKCKFLQVYDTIRYCNKKLSATTMKNLKEFNKRGDDKMRHSILSKHQDEGSKTPRVETG